MEDKASKTQKNENPNIPEIGTRYDVSDWLTVPKSETIITNDRDKKLKASELQSIVNRLAINRPDAKVEYYIRIFPD